MKPVILMVLDGWGMAPPSFGNAITEAKLPTFDEIEKFYPACTLQASGIAVGLPWGESGNSETGHMNMGAGKIIYQYLPRIILSIYDESFFRNPAFLEAVNHVKKNNSSLHLMGLVSSGGVHSYIDHLYGLFELAKKENLQNVYLHIFSDGKDAPPKEGAKFIGNLQERLKKYPQIKIASVMGRVYAMDRDNNWGRTQKAYECMVLGKGAAITNPARYLDDSYDKKITDEQIDPATVETANGGPQSAENYRDHRIKDGDAVIFFNFREDSVRQLTRAFVDREFKQFERKFIENLCFVSMTRYDPTLNTKVAFEPINIDWPLARVISEANEKQLHVAETEKYAHVTYFFNGLKEEPWPGEERILVPSLSTHRVDLLPKMRAEEITDIMLENLKTEKYDFMLVNFANSDMLGHTGNMQATITGIQTLDACVRKITGMVLATNATLIITSDHGNSEEMLDPYSGTVLTEHTSNPVPFYLINWRLKKEKTPDQIEAFRQAVPFGILADVAPTIINIMDLNKPSEMSGKSLLHFLNVSPEIKFV